MTVYQGVEEAVSSSTTWALSFVIRFFPWLIAQKGSPQQLLADLTNLACFIPLKFFIALVSLITTSLEYPLSDGIASPQIDNRLHLWGITSISDWNVTFWPPETAFWFVFVVDVFARGFLGCFVFNFTNISHLCCCRWGLCPLFIFCNWSLPARFGPGGGAVRVAEVFFVVPMRSINSWIRGAVVLGVGWTTTADASTRKYPLCWCVSCC